MTIDTEHDVTYTEADPTHCYSRSHSTRVSQVENAGTPEEHNLPDGQASGFLWRIASYWRLVEREGGVYLEEEVITLSRAVPSGLRWIAEPFLSSVPRESLQDTLGLTRSAVLAKLKSASKASRSAFT